MSEYNDKSDTFEFDPMKDNKPRVERAASDPYTSARKNNPPERREEKNGRALLYVAIILAVLLVISVVLTVFILKNDQSDPIPPENGETVIQEEEEEPSEEEPEIILECTVTFYSDSVIKQGDTYTVLADLYDGELYKFDNRKLTISSETDIREKGGKRINKDALIYLIEEMAGESLAFSAEIREEDNVLLSVTFDESIANTEEPEEPVPPEEEVPPTQEQPEEGEIIPPGEPVVDGI